MSLFDELDKTHSRLTLMLEQSLKKWDLTASQFRLLDILGDQERLRSKDLANLLDIDVAAATRLVDRLEQKNILVKIRCHNDRRVCFISIEDSFKFELKKIKEHQKRVETFFLDQIEPENREIFLKVVNTLSNIKKYRSGDIGLSVVI